MGGLESVLREESKHKTKEKAKFYLEEIVDLIPIVGGAASALFVHELASDYGEGMKAVLKTFEANPDIYFSISTFYSILNIVTSSVTGWFSHNILRSALGKKVVKLVGKDKNEGKDKQNKGFINWFLERPFLTALIPTAIYLSLNIPVMSAVSADIVEMNAHLNNAYFSWSDYPDKIRTIFDSKEELKTFINEMYYSVLLMTSSITAGIYGLSYYATSLLDTLSKEDSKKFLYHSAKSKILKLKTSSYGSLKELEKAVECVPCRIAFFDLATDYIKEGYLDQALVNINSGISREETPKLIQLMRESSLFSPNYYAFSYFRFKRKLRRNPDNLENHLNMLVFSYMVGDYSYVERIKGRISEKFPENLDSKAIYALMLEESGDKEKSAQEWKKTLDLLLSDTELQKKFKKKGESANEILEYEPREFFRNMFLFKRGDRKSLEEETRLTNNGRALSEPFEDYRVPESRSIFPFGDSYVYTLKREKGQLLYELTGKKDMFLKTADFLALIHARMPSEGLEPVNLKDYLERKVYNPDLHLPERTIEMMNQSLLPLLEYLKEEPFVFNKDGHPEQWIVTEGGKIIALDWENKGLVPMQFDLANLTDYGDYFDDKEKQEIITQYAESYNKYSEDERISDFNNFHLKYLQSVIFRSLCLCSAWSSPERPVMSDKRHLLVENSTRTIDLIKEHHPEHYWKEEGNYDGLREALGETKSVVIEHEHGG